MLRRSRKFLYIICIVLVLPALVFLMWFCVTINPEGSAHVIEIHQSVQDSKTSVLETEFGEQNLRQYNGLIANTSDKFYAKPITCIPLTDTCTLHCSSGSVSSLPYSMFSFRRFCSDTVLNLLVTQCEFKFGTLEQSFFFGAGVMARLSIDECNLQTIEANAFQHPDIRSLNTLILTNNQLITLQDNTFEGLTNLRHFKFVQTPLNTPFKGETFLKPMAAKLVEATLQPQINASEISDPLMWWRDLKMYALTALDLSNTNFQGTLNSTTFQNFINLRILKLFNCNLLSIKSDVFDFITNDFNYLDLQFNHLKALDSSFLQKVARTGVAVKLNLNDWFCDCRGEMLKYIALNSVLPFQNLTCSSPKKWENMNFKQAIRACWEPTIITPMTTTDSYTIETTLATTSTTSISTSNSTGSPLLPSLKTIKCFSNDGKTNSFSVNIPEPRANFTLKTVYNTLIMTTIDIRPHWRTFSIIYFTTPKVFSFIPDNRTNNYLHDLKPSLAYTICLLEDSMSTVSPFDCKSYFVVGEKQSRAWLSEKDRTWIISLISITTIVIFLASTFIAYKLLRYNPHWLPKGQRNRTRPSAVLRSGSSRSDHHHQSPQTSAGLEESSHYLSSYPPLDGEHIEIYCSQHVVPQTRAPILPPIDQFTQVAHPSRSTTATNNRTICSNNASSNVVYLDIIADDPIYETID